MTVPQNATSGNAQVHPGGAAIAYQAGVMAERERCVRLARQHDARYIPGCGDPDCPHPGRHMATAPFADLLTEGTTP